MHPNAQKQWFNILQCKMYIVHICKTQINKNKYQKRTTYSDLSLFVAFLFIW